MKARILSFLAAAIMLLSHNAWLAPVAGLSITVPAPIITDSKDNVVEDVWAGQLVTIHYDYANTRSQPQPFIMLFEVRDNLGVSVHIAWQSGVAEPSDKAATGISWMPETSADHEIKVFIIESPDDPQVLSAVAARSIFVE